MFDDLGYNDLSCYYQPTRDAARIDTPNVDRVASEGLRFTSFYAAASTGVASRAAFLTGSYPPRVGLSKTDNPNGYDLTPASEIFLNPNDMTIAEMLKTKGYATGCFGKWELGFKGAGLATRHGFDKYYGPLFRDRSGNHMYKNEKAAEVVADEYLTADITQEAIRFVQHNQNRPFFLLVTHPMPHVPLAAGERFRGKSQRGAYGDAVMELDWSVGQITEALRRYGIDEHTILVVTSDNGADVRLGPDGGSGFPLRDGKRSSFEGGFRVPFIARWPGSVPAGATCASVASLMDLMPTMMSITGAYSPRFAESDGKNIRELMASPGGRSPYDAFYYYNRNNLDAVRSGKWKLVFATRGAPELYDLESDPGESNNVADANSGEVKRLQVLADDMRQRLGDDVAGYEGNARGEPGSAATTADTPYEFDE